MAYSELIKNFSRIRSYMRDFYVYGFKRRDEYVYKSARSYDNERRRVESWLGDYMAFRRTDAGKNVFLTVDSRTTAHNPFYKAFKAKSFTDGDITLHFLLFDILLDETVACSLQEIAEQIADGYLARFDVPMEFDESTLRKKLREYVSLGLLETEKQGKRVLYRRTKDLDLATWQEAIAFFSEAAPAGVIGSFLLDKLEAPRAPFVFKHHYINHALDTEILCTLFDAMSRRSTVHIESFSRRAQETREAHLVPLRIFVSVQSGRQYLLAWHLRFRKTVSFRLDRILSAEIGEAHEEFDLRRRALDEKQQHMWGVICDDRAHPQLERVSFTVRFGRGEHHILDRLEREKRCGTVTRIDENTARFTAEVYDTTEMIPWIRTFLCRITELDFSNKIVEAQFRKDFETLCVLYAAGGETDALS